MALTDLHAEGVLDYGGPGPSPAPPARTTKPTPAVPPDSELLEPIRKFHTNGQTIRSGSECESLLVEAGRRLGRPLTLSEIENNIDAILQATGEALVGVRPPAPTPSPGPPPPDDIYCFTGEMKVLTPKGEVPISQLKPGDEVVSVDISLTGQITLVANRVAVNPSYADQSYGTLKDLPRPIQVTSRHQFYSTWRQAGQKISSYKAIEDIPPEARLLYGEGGAWNSTQTEIPRGEYRPNVGRAPVFDLQLEGHPRNYIVEGVLVHNAIKTCI